MMTPFPLPSPDRIPVAVDRDLEEIVPIRDGLVLHPGRSTAVTTSIKISV